MKFRKKPVVIEAFQMTQQTRIDNRDWPNWLNEAWQRERKTPGAVYPTLEGTGDGTLSIMTPEGEHLVSWNDFIIQGVKGELYPCKPDIFAMTYEQPSELDEISAMDLLTSFRKGISDLVEKNPNASAKEVLKGLELTQGMLDLFKQALEK